MVRNVYILFSGTEPPTARDDQEIMDLVDPSTPLPPWFSEEDLVAYASLYEKSGFRFALQVPYRYPVKSFRMLYSYVDKTTLRGMTWNSMQVFRHRLWNYRSKSYSTNITDQWPEGLSPKVCRYGGLHKE